MIRRHQVRTTFTILYWVFYAPFLITKYLYRGTVRVVGAFAIRNCDALQCPACRQEVSLLGRWECGWCGRVFDGYAFAACKSRGCGAVPPFINCQHCGLTVDNPTLF